MSSIYRQKTDMQSFLCNRDHATASCKHETRFIPANTTENSPNHMVIMKPLLEVQELAKIGSHHSTDSEKKPFPKRDNHLRAEGKFPSSRALDQQYRNKTLPGSCRGRDPPSPPESVAALENSTMSPTIVSLESPYSCQILDSVMYLIIHISYVQCTVILGHLSYWPPHPNANHIALTSTTKIND